jgi:hypothetical protein
VLVLVPFRLFDRRFGLFLECLGLLPFRLSFLVADFPGLEEEPPLCVVLRAPIVTKRSGVVSTVCLKNNATLAVVGTLV